MWVLCVKWRRDDVGTMWGVASGRCGDYVWRGVGALWGICVVGGRRVVRKI